jgi:4-alpha-glucanotransferase
MNRCAGLLLHPLSLPGSPGGGTLDHRIDVFLDFCKTHHQSIWQVLPLGPTGYGDSPYQSFSTHAGNPYLISLDELQEQGLATPDEVLKAEFETPDGKVDYCKLYEIRRPVLYQVAGEFEGRATTEQKAEFAEFCDMQAHWLEDYALYMTIKEQQQKSWQDWPSPLRKRRKAVLDKIRKEEKGQLQVHKVIQWFFDTQWQKVRAKAKEAGVKILGDIPIFVALDSADAWANPTLFQFDKERRPTAVAGVPPDYFSVDGQLWGNPLYNWNKHEKTRFRWWADRIRSALRLYDMLRIDHFRGFAGYWSVPTGEKTAKSGAWIKAPGGKLFNILKKEFPDLPIVAEDLGDITPDVHELRDRFKLPGMKVLQFAFSDPSNDFLPHNYSENFVVYTGTHDNDTTAGWYEDPERTEERRYFCHYLGIPDDCPAEEAVEHMVRLAMRSVAKVAIVPFQDVLKKGADSRMNTPSEAADNWQWRMTEEELEQKQDWLLEATWLTGRKGS